MAHFPTEEELEAEWKAQPLIERIFMWCVGAIVVAYMWVTGKLRH